MRALIVTLLLALAGGAAFYWYQQNQPPEAPPPVAEPPPPPKPRADQCGGVDARYALRTDPTITLTMENLPPTRGPASMMSQFSFYNVGQLVFVLRKPDAKEHRFVLLKSAGYTQNYLFPVTNDRIQQPQLNDLITVSMFDGQYGYFPNAPIGDSASPEHIWAPGIARWVHPLSKHGGDIVMDMAFFDFTGCVETFIPLSVPSPTPAPAQ